MLLAGNGISSLMKRQSGGLSLFVVEPDPGSRSANMKVEGGSQIRRISVVAATSAF